jgi:L-arabinokinase
VTLVFYVSGHGFGHATRTFEVIRAVQNLDARAQIVLRCALPEAFVQRSLGESITQLPVETDVGMIQIDSLRIDAAASARAAEDFYRAFNERINKESEIIVAARAALVVGDIPPLAFAAAARAGVPSVAIANFTWDWIYRIYPEFALTSPDVVGTIGDAYAETTLALRLPFPGGFETMRAVRDIPLIARQSQHGRERARQRLGLDARRPIVLASFGGHGIRLPYERIAASGEFVLLMTDHETEPARHAGSRNIVVASREMLAAADLRYEDLVAAADVVVSKPGYGIVSECIANDTALLYTSRGTFAEYDVMTLQMPRVMRARYIDQEQLREGDWNEAVAALLAQPAPPERLPVHGALVAASSLLALACA